MLDTAANNRVQTICLVALTMIALGASLYWLRPVLVPFVLAVFLTFCLTPLIDLQTRYLRLPRMAAITTSVLLGFALLGVCGSLVAASIGSATRSNRLEDYEKQLQTLTEQITESVPLDRFGIQIDTSQITQYFTLQETISWQFVSGALGEAASLISNGTLVMIILLFLLLGQKSPGRASGVLGEIESRVKSYVVNTVVLSGVTGLLIWLTLALLGVEFAGIFGLLAFLLNFVPSVGAIIASLLPLPVVLLSPEMSITAKVLAIALPAVIQFVIGSFIQPRVQGYALDLHPVVLLLALIFFGMIWGVTGAFLATPIIAVVRIVLGRIAITRPLGEVLAGHLDVLSEGGQ